VDLCLEIASEEESELASERYDAAGAENPIWSVSKSQNEIDYAILLDGLERYETPRPLSSCVSSALALENRRIKQTGGGSLS
jgi:hypothetical protein